MTPSHRKIFSLTPGLSEGAQFKPSPELLDAEADRVPIVTSAVQNVADVEKMTTERETEQTPIRTAQTNVVSMLLDRAPVQEADNRETRIKSAENAVDDALEAA